MAIKTVSHNTAKDLKALITKEGIRKDYLKVVVIGYIGSGEYEPFENDEEYYHVFIRDTRYEFDKCIVETTSLAKANQRAVQIMNALHGYRGNRVDLIEFDGRFESDNL